MNRYAVIVIAAVAAASTTGGAVVAAPDDIATTPGNPAEAVFGSESLDLSEDWGTASACIELGDVTECYDTEAELLAAHPEALAESRSVSGRGFVAASALVCSSSTRLYNGYSYTSGVLYLNTRGVIHNMSSFGFDNMTSSYRIGPCSVSMFSAANAGGSVYPGYTGAWAQYASMAWGWNDVVSSVYMY
ncbi:MAG: hypothetical protein ACRDZZ_07080 [Ilumatobacteraceae bacterium]